MEKKYSKVRNLLSNDYHLCMEFKDNNIEWKLFKKYDDPKIYFSKDNRPIMTSETNTYEELLEYAKKHRKYNLEIVLSVQFMISSSFLLIISIINIFIKNTGIRYFLWGANFITLLTLLTITIISKKNFNVISNEYLEWLKDKNENI